MICVTTPALENREIAEYLGMVAAEAVVSGVAIGGVVEVIEGLDLDLSMQTSRFREARERAMAEIRNQARDLRADAILGIRFEFCTFGKNGLLNLVAAYGTAVRTRLTKEDAEKQRVAELRERASFFVAIEGRQRGPFSLSQLSDLVDQGRISPSTNVQPEDSGETVPLSTLL